MRKVHRPSSGFSLIELLITIAILGILAAIAVPSYQSYVIRSGRSEGMGLLMTVMSQQENSYRNNLTYTTDLTDLGYRSNAAESESGLYVVTASSCTSGALTRCVLLTATAQGRQARDGNLTLDSAGNREGEWQ